MAANVTIVLKDEPGQLAVLGESMGEAGISLLGMSAMTGEGRGVINVLVGDGEAARSVLESAGMGVADVRQALVVDVQERPGSLGELARELAETGVNIELMYSTFEGTRVAILTDDMSSAKSALS